MCITCIFGKSSRPEKAYVQIKFLFGKFFRYASIILATSG